MSPIKDKKILLILTGSIGAYKAATLISSLKKQQAVVKTVTTASALKFIGESTLEGLSGLKNESDLFQSGDQMSHISLARWADLIFVYPGTANFIGQWALGLAPDLPTTLLLATDVSTPQFLAPAMNPSMWESPVVQQHLEKLKARGVKVFYGESGVMACGESGMGRLYEPDNALELIIQFFTPQAGPRVLITYGGTEESIDSVRSIKNTSTGLTGSALTDYLSKKGYQVTALRSKIAPKSASAQKQKTFTDFASLQKVLEQELQTQKFQAVIHLAAVSDYSVLEVLDSNQNPIPVSRKVSVDGDIFIHLKKNPKLLSLLKSYSQNKKLIVVGFKLTVENQIQESHQAVNQLFGGDQVDYIVHNDLSKISEKSHGYSIFNAWGEKQSGATKAELFKDIDKLLADEFQNTRSINHDAHP